MYPDLFRLVRDVRDAPGKINRYRDPRVADDAIERDTWSPTFRDG